MSARTTHSLRHSRSYRCGVGFQTSAKHSKGINIKTLSAIKIENTKKKCSVLDSLQLSILITCTCNDFKIRGEVCLILSKLSFPGHECRVQRVNLEVVQLRDPSEFNLQGSFAKTSPLAESFFRTSGK